MNSLIDLYPLHDWIFIDLYDDGTTLPAFRLGKHKFWLPPDDKFGPTAIRRPTDQRHPGIRERWAMILATTDQAEEVGLKVGQKVLCERLKWTRGFHYSDSSLLAWAIRIENVLLIDEEGFTPDELEILSIRYADE